MKKTIIGSLVLLAATQVLAAPVAQEQAWCSVQLKYVAQQYHDLENKKAERYFKNISQQLADKAGNRGVTDTQLSESLNNSKFRWDQQTKTEHDKLEWLKRYNTQIQQCVDLLDQ